MPQPGEFPNILLVTVDCLRRDRISAYGHHRQTTPFLDSLLDSSLHCTSAHAAAPWTAPSVVSLLTGLYPYNHGGGLLGGDLRNVDVDEPPSLLPRGIPVLHELLGVPAAAFLGVWTASLPLQDRFDLVRLMQKKGGADIAASALAWMREQERGFFCWLHLGEPHDPLEVPRELRDVFGPADPYRRTRRWSFTRRDDDVNTEAFAEYRAARERLYDAAVLGTDGIIAGLWNAMGGMRERTTLVVSADHGEEMWDHRDEEIASFTDPRGVAGVGHGHTLFQELLLVPLILRGPGIEPGVVEHNVSLVDVVPTLVSAAGGDIDRFDGRPLGDPERPVSAQVIAYGHEKRAVISGGRKLVVSEGDSYERAFALDAATRMEVSEAPALADELRPLLPPDAVPGGARSIIDAEMEAHLRDLGYIE